MGSGGFRSRDALARKNLTEDEATSSSRAGKLLNQTLCVRFNPAAARREFRLGLAATLERESL
jgi:hypothetical protein